MIIADSFTVEMPDRYLGKITFSSPVISIETNTHECIDADKNFIGIFGLCYRSKNNGYNYEHSETY